MHFFISTLGLIKVLPIEDVFACIIAATIHDVDHPGYNNFFMIATSSPIAIRYNDVSVLEQFHCSRGFEIMADPSCNIMETLSPEQAKSVRASIVSMVLATDMINHFEHITKFKNKIIGDGLDINDYKSRQILMDIAMKCGDISNAAKPPHLAMHWTALIMDEFYHQVLIFKKGDEEKRLGLIVSPLMDRQTTVISKCQLGFIEFIVTPLYEVWDKYLNEEGKLPALKFLKSNQEYWKKMNDELQDVKVE